MNPFEGHDEDIELSIDDIEDVSETELTKATEKSKTEQDPEAEDDRQRFQKINEAYKTSPQHLLIERLRPQLLKQAITEARSKRGLLDISDKRTLDSATATIDKMYASDISSAERNKMAEVVEKQLATPSLVDSVGALEKLTRALDKLDSLAYFSHLRDGITRELEQDPGNKHKALRKEQEIAMNYIADHSNAPELAFLEEKYPMVAEEIEKLQ